MSVNLQRNLSPLTLKFSNFSKQVELQRYRHLNNVIIFENVIMLKESLMRQVLPLDVAVVTLSYIKDIPEPVKCNPAVVLQDQTSHGEGKSELKCASW